MTAPVRSLVVGVGNMGASHASACHRMEGSKIIGLCARSIASKTLPDEFAGYPRLDKHEKALARLKPDEVFPMEDEPGHRERSDREQASVPSAIRKDFDQAETMEAAVNAPRIVLGAERNIAEERAIRLD